MNIDSAAITAMATSAAVLIAAFEAWRRTVNKPAFTISHVRRQGDFLVCMVSVIPVSYHFRIERMTCNGKGIARTRLGADGKVEFVPEHAHPSRLDTDVDVFSTATSSRHSYPFELSVRLRKRQSSARISFHTSRSLLCVRYKTPAIKASAQADTTKHID